VAAVPSPVRRSEWSPAYLLVEGRERIMAIRPRVARERIILTEPLSNAKAMVEPKLMMTMMVAFLFFFRDTVRELRH